MEVLLTIFTLVLSVFERSFLSFWLLIFILNVWASQLKKEVETVLNCFKSRLYVSGEASELLIGSS